MGIGIINRARNAYERRRNVNKTIAELSAMSDRELNDIGISRGQIRSVAESVIETHREARSIDTPRRTLKELAYAAWCNYQNARTIEALYQLSDSQLKDIGIERRDNIPTYVNTILNTHRKIRDKGE